MHNKPTLKSIMEKETVLLARFADMQGHLQEIVVERRWTGLEKTIGSLQKLSERIEELEQKRYRLFCTLKASLGANENETFTQVISRLAFDERQEMMNLYRKLKIAVIRLKGRSGRLGYYVRILLDSTSQVLGELFPHRKGRLYSRFGRTKAAAEESIVLDQKF